MASSAVKEAKQYGDWHDLIPEEEKSYISLQFFPINLPLHYHLFQLTHHQHTHSQ